MVSESNRRSSDPELIAIRQSVEALREDLGEKMGTMSTNIAVLAATTTIRVEQLKEEQEKHHRDDEKRFDGQRTEIDKLNGFMNRTKGAEWMRGIMGGAFLTAAIEVGKTFLGTHGK